MKYRIIEYKVNTEDGSDYDYYDAQNGNLVTDKSKSIFIDLYKGPMVSRLEIPSFIKGIPVKLLSEYTLFSLKDVLEEIKLPENILFISNAIFFGFTKLKKVELNDKLREIHEGCFQMCSNLEEIRIPASVKKIESESFRDCINLRDVIFERDMDQISISNKAFMGCKNLNSNLKMKLLSKDFII